MNAYFRRHSKQRIVAIIFGLTLLYAVPFFTVSGQSDVFMKVEGIAGESTAAGHEGWIELQTVSMETERAVSVGVDGTRRATKPVLSDFVVEKMVDKSSPLLFTEAVVGAGGRNAEIHLTKMTASGQQTYLKYRLTDVLVSSLSTSGSDQLSEAVSLDFLKIEMEYIPFNSSGKPGTPVTASYDVVQPTE